MSPTTASPQSHVRAGSLCLKFSLLLIVVFNFEFKEQTQIQAQIFQRDLQFCEQCFQHQRQNCTKFLQKVLADQAPSYLGSLLTLLEISTKRLMHFWKLKTSTEEYTKIISKSVTNSELKSIENVAKDSLNLRKNFVESENLEGLQLCPKRHSPRLVKYLEQQTQNFENTIWLHFTLGVEPLLMPFLENKGFPVPKTYAACGFTLFQEYVGKALVHYYNHKDFKLKLKIAKELLAGVLKFSKGWDGFRIYITDLSADNLIWNEEKERLYFVDLDSIIILDSADKQLQQKVHKHVFIECDGCFAYSQQDICAHQLSDINIFAACQFLRENLSQNREAGFMYPIPADILDRYPEIVQLIDDCVDCAREDCLNRFAVSEKLIQLFEFILMEI